MTGTGYSVATAAQLLGSKPPVRIEAEERYERRMKALDQQNQDDMDSHRNNHAQTFRDAGRTGGVGSGVNDRASSTSQRNGSFTRSTTSNRPDKAQKPEVDIPAEFSKRNINVKPGLLPDNYYTHDIAKISKIDTTTTTPPPPSIIGQPSYVPFDIASGPSTTNKTGDTAFLPRDTIRTHRRNSQALYFSPRDVNTSLISLCDPLNVPVDEALTTIQTRYDHEHTPSRGIMHSSSSPTSASSMQRQRDSVTSSISATRNPVTLKPEQVDRLVESLAKCPLIHTHVSRQWWDDDPVADDTATISDTASIPSLTSGSSAMSSMFYNHPNDVFLTERRSASVTEAILEEEFARNFPDHPKARHPVQAARAASKSTRFGGIALADPKIQGVPIRFISENYRLGANVLQVGACSFLSIPYGTTVQSQLRVEPASLVNSTCRIMLQVVNQVLERRTGRKSYLLAAELDVTESFTLAALTELADGTGLPLSDIQIQRPAEKQLETFEEVDWCALADDFQESVTITDIIEHAARSFAELKPENCTMQTLTLMSELERLKTHHQDFLVVRPTGYHKNNKPSGIHIPWTSQHLDHILLDDTTSYSIHSHNQRETSDASRILRDRVVAAVAEGCTEGHEFDTKIWWGDQWRAIHCVPLRDSTTERRPAAWICFLSDLGRYRGSLYEAFHTLDDARVGDRKKRHRL